MKSLVIAAIAFGAAATLGGNGDSSLAGQDRPRPAVAQADAMRVAGRAWRQRRPYDWCEARILRLQQFDGRVRRDGRVSTDEMRIASSLSADIARNCRGGRGVRYRGWYYG